MALDFIRKEHYNTEDLIRIVALLRAPGGCPWDQAQTHASIKKNFIEETYEVIEAINRQSTAGLQEELAGEVRDLAGGYLTDLKIEDVTYDLGRIDLGSDVVDMLADNLDPKGTANPRNTLDIYGEIISALPVSLQFSPRFYPTEVEFDIRVEPNVKAKIGETRPAPDHRRYGDHPPRQTGEIFPRLRIHARPENRHRTASCQARRSETQPLTRRHT